MKVVIIEDELVSSRRLERLLKAYPFEIMERFQTVKTAVKWFKISSHPDLIFMDIHLADGLCFDIFKEVEIKSAIIFTTAFNDYTIKAFDYNSISYLLKPINQTKLDKALEKARSFVKTQSELNELKNIINYKDFKNYKSQFAVKVGLKIKLIDAKNITCFYSENNTTYIKTKNSNYIINESLTQLIDILNPSVFFQINRKFIVSKAFLDRISTFSNSRFKIHIKDYTESLTVSRNRAKDFKNWLNK